MYDKIYFQVSLILDPLSINTTKWSSTLKQFVVNLPTNYLSMFEHFVELDKNDKTTNGK